MRWKFHWVDDCDCAAKQVQSFLDSLLNENFVFVNQLLIHHSDGVSDRLCKHLLHVWQRLASVTSTNGIFSLIESSGCDASFCPCIDKLQLLNLFVSQS